MTTVATSTTDPTPAPDLGQKKDGTPKKAPGRKRLTEEEKATRTKRKVENQALRKKNKAEAARKKADGERVKASKLEAEADSARRTADGTPAAPPAEGPFVVPEFKPRKDATDIKDLHSAAHRVDEEERKLAEYKRRLAARLKSEYGTECPEVTDPIHLLGGQRGSGPQGSVTEEEALMFVETISYLPPVLFRLEAQPQAEAKANLAKSLSLLSRHYPDMDSKMMDWFFVVTSSVAWATPWLVETQAKRNDEWDAVKPQLQAAGVVPSGGKS